MGEHLPCTMLSAPIRRPTPSLFSFTTLPSGETLLSILVYGWAWDLLNLFNNLN